MSVNAVLAMLANAVIMTIYVEPFSTMAFPMQVTTGLNASCVYLRGTIIWPPSIIRSGKREDL